MQDCIMHPNIGDALSGSFFSIPHTLKALEEGETTKTPDIHIPSRSVGIFYLYSYYTGSQTKSQGTF